MLDLRMKRKLNLEKSDFRPLETNAIRLDFFKRPLKFCQLAANTKYISMEKYFLTRNICMPLLAHFVALDLNESHLVDFGFDEIINGMMLNEIKRGEAE